MKIAICDDMKVDREVLKASLSILGKEMNTEFAIIEYSTPLDLYEDFQKGEDFDIIFFDVYMGDELGTDTAKRLRETGYKNRIIFCTSSLEHALDGFRVHADGYLVKPFTYQDFKDSISKIADLFQQEEKRVKFTSERIEYSIPLSSIYLIETDKKGCVVHTEKDSLFTWKKLKEFVEEISSNAFYPIGRYSIVNMDAIESIQEDCIILKNGIKVFPPKRDFIHIKQDINNYIWQSMRR